VFLCELCGKKDNVLFVLIRAISGQKLKYIAIFCVVATVAHQ
jgi:hypothetical protein